MVLLMMTDLDCDDKADMNSGCECSGTTDPASF